ncbi:MAG: glycosyltransferase family 2 protein [Candidatus Acidiferrales bacterium]
MSDLSIIIVTWNVRKYAEECLTSIYAQKCDASFEVIVVENASTDGTAEMIREQFPQVKLIANSENLGFARANNIGMEFADGKYLCLINPDVSLPSDCLSNMYRYMETQPTIGLLGPKMRLGDGKVGRSGMRFPTIWNSFLRALALDSLFKRATRFKGLLMADFQFDYTRDMDVLNGWFWMVRREAVNQVGPLDEHFFMYGEDIDWCKRFHLAGWRVVFYSDAEAIHYGGASSANAPVRFFIEMQRANLRYWKKYHGLASTFLYLAAVSLNYFIRTIGWIVVYLADKSWRSKALFEVKRNAACIRWLLGFVTVNEATEK